MTNRWPPHQGPSRWGWGSFALGAAWMGLKGFSDWKTILIGKLLPEIWDVYGCLGWKVYWKVTAPTLADFASELQLTSGAQCCKRCCGPESAGATATARSVDQRQCLRMWEIKTTTPKVSHWAPQDWSGRCFSFSIWTMFESMLYVQVWGCRCFKSNPNWRCEPFCVARLALCTPRGNYTKAPQSGGLTLFACGWCLPVWKMTVLKSWNSVINVGQ